MAAEDCDCVTRLGIPDAGSAVRGGCYHASTVRAKGGARQGERMPLKNGYRLTSPGIPDARRFVV